MRAPNHPAADVRMTYKPADLGCGFSVPSEECEQNPWQPFPSWQHLTYKNLGWVNYVPSAPKCAATGAQHHHHSTNQSAAAAALTLCLTAGAQSLPGFLRGGAGPTSGNIRLGQFSLCDQVDQSSAVTLRHKYVSFVSKEKL